MRNLFLCEGGDVPKQKVSKKNNWTGQRGLNTAYAYLSIFFAFNLKTPNFHWRNGYDNLKTVWSTLRYERARSVAVSQNDMDNNCKFEHVDMALKSASVIPSPSKYNLLIE